MKAAICNQPFEITVREVPTPVPGPDELLIQVKASAICGSDMKAYEGKHPLIRPPIILGHEFSGVIVGMGSQVNGFRIGERVVAEPSSVCGQCFFCRRMEYYLCDHLEQLGHQLPGSFAEYTLAKARFTYLLPRDAPFERGALAQPLAIGIHAVRRAGIRRGQTVLILGTGTIGLLVLQLALQKGARVFVSDPIDFKLDKAKALGAHRAWNGLSAEGVKEIVAETNGLGPDLVIEAAGSSATIEQAFSTVRRGGTILLLGLTGHAMEEVPLERVTLNELNVLGMMRYATGDFAEAIEMIHQERIDLDSLISKRFALPEISEVFKETYQSPEKVLKSIMII
jgi:L-iditol 2-dehydrogenase